MTFPAITLDTVCDRNTEALVLSLMRRKHVVVRNPFRLRPAVSEEPTKHQPVHVRWIAEFQCGPDRRWERDMTTPNTPLYRRGRR